MKTAVLSGLSVITLFFLGACCPQYDCFEPYTTGLVVTLKTEGDSVSFAPSSLDSILLVRSGPNLTKPDTQIWRYEFGEYVMYYPTAAWRDRFINLETPIIDTITVSPVRGQSILLNNFRRLTRTRQNEFGCEGCPEIVTQMITVNGVNYDLKLDFSDKSLPVDISGGVVVIKAVR